MNGAGPSTASIKDSPKLGIKDDNLLSPKRRSKRFQRENDQSHSDINKSTADNVLLSSEIINVGTAKPSVNNAKSIENETPSGSSDQYNLFEFEPEDSDFAQTSGVKSYSSKKKGLPSPCNESFGLPDDPIFSNSPLFSERRQKSPLDCDVANPWEISVLDLEHVDEPWLVAYPEVITHYPDLELLFPFNFEDIRIKVEPDFYDFCKNRSIGDSFCSNGSSECLETSDCDKCNSVFTSTPVKPQNNSLSVVSTINISNHEKESVDLSVIKDDLLRALEDAIKSKNSLSNIDMKIEIVTSENRDSPKKNSINCSFISTGSVEPEVTSQQEISNSSSSSKENLFNGLNAQNSVATETSDLVKKSSLLDTKQDKNVEITSQNDGSSSQVESKKNRGINKVVKKKKFKVPFKRRSLRSSNMGMLTKGNSTSSETDDTNVVADMSPKKAVNSAARKSISKHIHLDYRSQNSSTSYLESSTDEIEPQPNNRRILRSSVQPAISKNEAKSNVKKRGRPPKSRTPDNIWSTGQKVSNKSINKSIEKNANHIREENTSLPRRFLRSSSQEREPLVKVAVKRRGRTVSENFDSRSSSKQLHSQVSKSRNRTISDMVSSVEKQKAEKTPSTRRSLRSQIMEPSQVATNIKSTEVDLDDDMSQPPKLVDQRLRPDDLPPVLQRADICESTRLVDKSPRISFNLASSFQHSSPNKVLQSSPTKPVKSILKNVFNAHGKIIGVKVIDEKHRKIPRSTEIKAEDENLDNTPLKFRLNNQDDLQDELELSFIKKEEDFLRENGITSQIKVVLSPIDFEIKEENLDSIAESLPKLLPNIDSLEKVDVVSSRRTTRRSNIFESQREKDKQIDLKVVESKAIGSSKRRNGNLVTACTEAERDAISEVDVKLENSCYVVGNLVWAQVCKFPYWPAIVCEDPIMKKFLNEVHKKNKIHMYYHIRFFGDNGRRAWIHRNHLMLYCSKQDLEMIANKLKSENKHQSVIKPYTINRSSKWHKAIEELESLKNKKYEDIILHLIDTFTNFKNNKRARKSMSYLSSAESETEDEKGPKRPLNESLSQKEQPDKRRKKNNNVHENIYTQKAVVEDVNANNKDLRQGSEVILGKPQVDSEQVALQAVEKSANLREDSQTKLSQLFNYHIGKRSRSLKFSSQSVVDTKKVENSPSKSNIDDPEQIPKLYSEDLSNQSSTENKIQNQDLDLVRKRGDESEIDDCSSNSQEEGTKSCNPVPNYHIGRRSRRSLKTFSVDTATCEISPLKSIFSKMSCDGLDKERLSQNKIDNQDSDPTKKRGDENKIDDCLVNLQEDGQKKHIQVSNYHIERRSRRSLKVSLKTTPNPATCETSLVKSVTSENTEKILNIPSNLFCEDLDKQPLSQNKIESQDSDPFRKQGDESETDDCFAKFQKEVQKLQNQVPNYHIERRSRSLKVSSKSSFDTAPKSDTSENTEKSQKKSSKTFGEDTGKLVLVQNKNEDQDSEQKNEDMESISGRLRVRKQGDESSDVGSKSSYGGSSSSNLYSFEYQSELHKRNNLFNGLTKIRVCNYCLKQGTLHKCKGKCGALFHLECAPKVSEPKQEKRSRKRESNSKKNKNETKKNDGPVITSLNVTPKANSIKKLNQNQVQIVTIRSKRIISTPKSSQLPANFHELSLAEQIDFKMKEVMSKFDGGTIYVDSTDSSSEEGSIISSRKCVNPEENKGLDTPSSNGTVGEKMTAKDDGLEETGDDDKSSDDLEGSTLSDKPDKIIRHVTADSVILDEFTLDITNFKCGFCRLDKDPPCFVCGLEVSLRGSSIRQKCSQTRCGKYYHPHCLKMWPQAQWSLGKWSRNQDAEDSFSCPAHVCHTCFSDELGSVSCRLPGDKMARCMLCPAAFHITTFCVPAGTDILGGTQIVCPRHRPKPVQPLNTTWCFICSEGGKLVCCDTCPTSVHPECQPISFTDDDKYICEDCESGRFPLYDEIVWVKLGFYRWWPALVLFPNEMPENIKALKHQRGDFAVRFFGTNDHYWVNKSRSFLFQEGDRGGSPGEVLKSKNKVYENFDKAIEDAAVAYKLKKEFKLRREAESINSLKPPPYVKINKNKPVGNVKTLELDLSNATACECEPSKLYPCGPDGDCINRLLMTECDPDICPAGNRCRNQSFQKREYPPMVPYKTQGRGWGLKSLAPIKKGQFVIEYVGDLIDPEEYQRRIQKMHEQKEENYYFMTIDNDRMIDAGPKGNLSRFMNHSCNPNCVTQKWTVKGDTRVGLFAKCYIESGSELTFNYNLEVVGQQKKVCKCGAFNCSGFIGVKAKFDKQDTVPEPRASNGRQRKYVKKAPLPPPSLPPCFQCSRKQSDISCNNKACNKGYHLKCLKLEECPEVTKFTCPRHNCNICSNRTIRCCVKCTNSYCPSHSDGNVRHDKFLGFVCRYHDPGIATENIDQENQIKGQEKPERTNKYVKSNNKTNKKFKSLKKKSIEDMTAKERELMREKWRWYNRVRYLKIRKLKRKEQSLKSAEGVSKISNQRKRKKKNITKIIRKPNLEDREKIRQEWIFKKRKQMLQKEQQKLVILKKQVQSGKMAADCLKKIIEKIEFFRELIQQSERSDFEPIKSTKRRRLQKLEHTDESAVSSTTSDEDSTSKSTKPKKLTKKEPIEKQKTEQEPIETVESDVERDDSVSSTPTKNSLDKLLDSSEEDDGFSFNVTRRSASRNPRKKIKINVRSLISTAKTS